MQIDLIKDFRDKELVIGIASLVKQYASNKINIMEVCGGHTHSIMKYALNDLFGDKVNFVHGPGCPVCIIPVSRIDEAIKLSLQKDVILCTLGDMLKIPGSKNSLSELRALGADIRALYTPLDVINIAKKNKEKNIIFFAIGFETTAPMSAVLIQKSLEFNNIFFHINHVTVPAPMHEIMCDANINIDGFLGPSHVSVITGSNIYEEISKTYKKPIAVSGFEPLDIAHSVLNLVLQHQHKTHEVFNQYKRAVKPEGNIKAQNLVNTYFKLVDFSWRGLGLIKNSALDLKDDYDHVNARKVFNCEVPAEKNNKLCICGDILRGHAKPHECKVFAKACTPRNPLGACMVSDEGSCAAYYKYRRKLA